MSLYIIQAQTGEFLHRQLNWLTPPDINVIFRTPHRDVALNQLIELNAKDIHLRATIIECNADSKGRPQLAAEPANAS